MSGALKHFFDNAYKPLLEKTRGLPYALFVKGGTDTDGAVAAVEKIVKGLEWKEVQPPLTVVGDLTDDAAGRLHRARPDHVRRPRHGDLLTDRVTTSASSGLSMVRWTPWGW